MRHDKSLGRIPRTAKRGHIAKKFGHRTLQLEESNHLLPSKWVPTSTKVESAKLRVKAGRYILINDILYKRSFFLPYLRYLGQDEVKYAPREIHKRIYDQHFRGRSLDHKAFRQGFYWPTIKKDTTDFVQKCDKCQRFARVPQQPSENLSSITAPWSFAQ